MSDANDTILAYLRSIEGKIDALAPRVKSIETWQDNANGKITMFGGFCVTIGAVIAWVISLFKH